MASLFIFKTLKKNQSKLEQYWTTNFPLNKKIKSELEPFVKNKIRMLDVGCGPFPKSGLFLKNFTIERILVDTMADAYHLVLDKYEINTNGQTIIQCDAEKLKKIFRYNSFEIIFSKNALDHTYDPIKAISNLIDLITPDGVIILEHYINEGKYTDYYGLHQWNFYIESNHFYISNKGGNINQNINLHFESVSIDSIIEENKIVNIIRKI